MRGLRHRIPPSEYAFYDVPDEELEGCLYYERRRELLFLKGKEMLVDAPADADSSARHSSELSRHPGNRAAVVSEPQFPDQTWFMLAPSDKAEYSRCASEEKRQSPEPIRLASDLGALRLRLIRIMPRIKRVELFLDLSQPNKRLEKSFKKMLLRLRQTPGTPANRTLVKETRGRKGAVKEKLLRLAIWRCRKAGLEPKEIIGILAGFRTRFSVSADTTLSKKIADTVKKTEHWLLASPL